MSSLIIQKNSSFKAPDGVAIFLMGNFSQMLPSITIWFHFYEKLYIFRVNHTTIKKFQYTACETYRKCLVSQYPISLGGTPEVRQKLWFWICNLAGPDCNFVFEGGFDIWTRNWVPIKNVHNQVTKSKSFVIPKNSL